MSLIPVDKARTQSAAFDLSQEQVLKNISDSIDANSKSGRRLVVMSYLKSAVSQQELDGALEKVRQNGYVVEIMQNSVDKDSHLIKVSW